MQGIKPKILFNRNITPLIQKIRHQILLLHRIRLARPLQSRQLLRSLKLAGRFQRLVPQPVRAEIEHCDAGIAPLEVRDCLVELHIEVQDGCCFEGCVGCCAVRFVDGRDVEDEEVACAGCVEGRPVCCVGAEELGDRWVFEFVGWSYEVVYAEPGYEKGGLRRPESGDGR